ncbi:hypothetical protein [Enterococcus casseliflavus]|uniref:hypothetical protein n=1 Tax=Enterococcus casseliflavus TaxID=37734 RepID=UPI0022E30E3D|nr:hypothetical protein [Enterococcus casseliflavus]
MSSNEYVETVTLMMEKQDMYLMWFLGILGVVLVFVGFLQWRLSSEQIKKIKSETKAEARKEIIDELIQNYSVNSIHEILNVLQETVDTVKNLTFDVSSMTIGQEFDFGINLFYFLKELENSTNKEEDITKFLVKNHHILYATESAIEELNKEFREKNISSKIDISCEDWSLSSILLEKYRKKYNNKELFKEFF